MNLVVKPVLADPFCIIPISIIVRDTIDAITVSICLAVEGVVVIRGIVLAIQMEKLI